MSTGFLLDVISVRVAELHHITLDLLRQSSKQTITEMMHQLGQLILFHCTLC